VLSGSLTSYLLQAMPSTLIPERRFRPLSGHVNSDAPSSCVTSLREKLLRGHYPSLSDEVSLMRSCLDRSDDQKMLAGASHRVAKKLQERMAITNQNAVGSSLMRVVKTKDKVAAAEVAVRAPSPTFERESSGSPNSFDDSPSRSSASSSFKVRPFLSSFASGLSKKKIDDGDVSDLDEDFSPGGSDQRGLLGNSGDLNTPGSVSRGVFSISTSSTTIIGISELICLLTHQTWCRCRYMASAGKRQVEFGFYNDTDSRKPVNE